MLAILTTHPVQWQVPVWQAIARDGNVPFEVWFLTDHGVKPTLDVEFGQTFAWDLPLLEGYPHRFLNVKAPARVDTFFGVKLAESLVPLLRQKSVRALWVNGWQVLAYWQAVKDAKHAGARVWLRGESNDLLLKRGWKASARHAMLGWFFRHVDEFLCIGSANRRLYENFGVAPNNLHFAPYAVDNERFARQGDQWRSQRDAIRSAWKIPRESFCLLFAGKFIPKKRPMDLVSAARLLATTVGANVHLLFVGNGELGAQLRSECNVVFDAVEDATAFADGRAPTASFVGFLNQNEIARAYLAADCLVLPSDHGETWGLVVNEAMATGLPSIVSTACGCAEDLVAAVDRDLCYPLGDTKSLASAIGRLLRGPREKTQWLQRIQAFSIDHTVEVARELYSRAARVEQVLERGAKRSQSHVAPSN